MTPIILLVKSENRLTFTDDAGERQWECRTDLWPGFNEAGQPRAPIPDGRYLAQVDETYAGDEAAYGPAFIHVDTERGRGIHGGGSDLDDPFAPEQGWEATYGCGRMQNKDLLELVALMRQYGGEVKAEVRA